MKTNEYVKFLTETIVSRMDTPKEIRKLEKEKKKLQEDPLLYKMFGSVPYAVLTGIKIATNKHLRKKGS